MTEFFVLTASISVVLFIIVVWIIFDTKHNDVDVVTFANCSNAKNLTEQVLGLEDDEAKHLKDFLIQIYDCGVLFTLSISKNKPKKYMGLYYPDRQHITIYAPWCKSIDDLNLYRPHSMPILAEIMNKA